MRFWYLIKGIIDIHKIEIGGKHSYEFQENSHKTSAISCFISHLTTHWALRRREPKQRCVGQTVVELGAFWSELEQWAKEPVQHKHLKMKPRPERTAATIQHRCQGYPGGTVYMRSLRFLKGLTGSIYIKPGCCIHAKQLFHTYSKTHPSTYTRTHTRRGPKEQINIYVIRRKRGGARE